MKNNSVTIRLKETLDVLSDQVLMKQIAQSKTFYRKGRKGFTFEEVFGEPLTLPQKKNSWKKRLAPPVSS